MAVATIVIPIAPYHIDHADEAIASAEAQTVPIEVIPIMDHQQRGAGWARNQGATEADTPFIVFLDADDMLAPDFVARTIARYERGTIVYTDWVNARGKRATLPDCTEAAGWKTGEVFRLVTKLVPTVFHRLVGGFDETLAGHEDFDYYARMHLQGICEVRCPYPLVTYRSALGQRSRAVVDSGILDSLALKYQGVKNMGCCGQPSPNGAYAQNPSPQFPGDVLVIANWPGNKSQVGRVTGRVYWGGNGKKMYIDPRDADAQPNLFKRIVNVQDIAPDIDSLMDLME